PRRFYSLSAQIQRDRKNYYAILESTQRGDLDVTAWLLWFLDALLQSINNADRTIDAALAKTRFWRTWHTAAMNSRQTEMLNRILDGFNGNLTTRKWAIITKTSQASALRDINELIELGALRRSDSSGRSTSYELTEIAEPNTE
ncbi:Fic family protein, partial [Nocardia sp. NPDC060220]|uniref:Fic family protein n=1 Tax=Nocardia sp. NPDC060220 TaxID=3347076 RepID=UPI0036559E0E